MHLTRASTSACANVGVCQVGAGEGDDDEDQTDVWFPAKLMGKGGGKSGGEFELEWEDPDPDDEAVFTADASELRAFLVHMPIKLRVQPKPAAKPKVRYLPGCLGLDYGSPRSLSPPCTTLGATKGPRALRALRR